MSEYFDRSATEFGNHAYPPGGVWPDAVRAGIGLAVGLGLMLVAAAGSVIFLVGAVLVLLFLAFAGAVWVRRGTVIRADAEGISAVTGLPAAAPFGLGSRRLAWGDMTGLTLRYFSTRRDRTGGWMQLTVKGPGGSVTAQSTISEFPALARRAGRAALRNGLPLGTATRRNLEALGLTPGPDGGT